MQSYWSRCLLQDNHTPFGWILKLWAEGRRIQNNTTSTGYIVWADDQTSLTYKDLAFNLQAFWGFLLQQIALLQAELGSGLCLLQPQQRLPEFDLSQLKDNPANSRIGWSFLQEPQNDLAKWQHWLMDQILDHQSLQEQFFQPKFHLHKQKAQVKAKAKVNQSPQMRLQALKDPQWQHSQVKQYFSLLHQFLSRLALLIFILGGQPPRGTELFSLRYCNSLHGGCRNIYIEQGLIGFVTLYHKGYALGGSLKIIHRYLPSAFSQVLVQYLVLVLPFTHQLHHLVYDKPQDKAPSAFLWAKADTTWDPNRLSQFLQQESQKALQIPLTIAPWRHLAIAISREFIPKGSYFDRETDQETHQILDQQACHTNSTAGTIYGRLASEGSGQIREFRERYRRVSRL